MSALEKVGAFLIEMAERTRAGAPERVVLSMSRYDIGDYLGLAAETVSRTLSDLRQSGAIRLEGTHRVRIVDRAALEEETGDGDWDRTGRRHRPADPFAARPARSGHWGFESVARYEPRRSTRFAFFEGIREGGHRLNRCNPSNFNAVAHPGAFARERVRQRSGSSLFTFGSIGLRSRTL